MCGKTLYETLGDLLRLNLLDEAEKTRKEFKISDSTERFPPVSRPDSDKL